MFVPSVAAEAAVFFGKVARLSRRTSRRKALNETHGLPVAAV